jgi:hypothetical protein
MLIELRNKKAAKLLHELEELQLIKVLKTTSQPKEKLSEKYAGVLPGNIADDIQNHVSESRSEWNNNVI